MHCKWNPWCLPCNATLTYSTGSLPVGLGDMFYPILIIMMSYMTMHADIFNTDATGITGHNAIL
jgi:hypothetical protein